MWHIEAIGAMINIRPFENLEFVCKLHELRPSRKSAIIERPQLRTICVLHRYFHNFEYIWIFLILFFSFAIFGSQTVFFFFRMLAQSYTPNIYIPPLFHYSITLSPLFFTNVSAPICSSCTHTCLLNRNKAKQRLSSCYAAANLEPRLLAHSLAYVNLELKGRKLIVL